MVFYCKFKSATYYELFPLEGPFIYIQELKMTNFESKYLSTLDTNDILISNAQTNQVNNELILCSLHVFLFYTSCPLIDYH